MSARHSHTKGQVFVSPGVVIRKTVKLKPPRYPVDDFAESSAVNKDLHGWLPSAKDSTTCQQSVEDVVCQPVTCSSEDRAPSTTAALDENGNPVEEIVATNDRQGCSTSAVSSDLDGSIVSLESDCIIPTHSDGKRNNIDRRRNSKSSFTSSKSEQHKTATLPITSASSHDVTPGVQLPQNTSHFQLTSAQVFLYDAFKEVLQLKSRGLAQVYNGQS